MWCRLGYDPREDASAKMYQLIDFRIKKRELRMLLCSA